MPKTLISDKSLPTVAVFCANPGVDRTLRIGAPLTVGGMNRVTGSETFQGSKGANVALMTSILGAEVSYFSFTGGEAGEFCRRLLTREGITQHLAASAAGARTNLKLTDPAGLVTEVNEKGGPVSAEETEALLALVREDTSKTLAICGSMPVGMPADTYAALIRLARKQGAYVALDSSGEGFFLGVRERPDLIKPNETELRELLVREGENDLPESTRALCARFAARHSDITLLCTAGAEGSYCFSPEGAWHVSAPRVAVRSTVGAGDVYLSAYLTSRCRLGTEGALRRAAAASACKLTMNGKDFPTAAQVEERANEIVLTPLCGENA